MVKKWLMGEILLVITSIVVLNKVRLSSVRAARGKRIFVAIRSIC